jgi:general secretion pathway protein I
LKSNTYKGPVIKSIISLRGLKLPAQERTAGFTLLEIMVALAITAVGIAAMMKVIGSSADIMNELDARLIASWVAGNQLTERRISPRQPRPGTQSERVKMGGRTWQFREEITRTADDDVYRVDIEVRGVGERNEAPLATVFGFIVSQADAVASRVQAGQGEGAGDE